MRRMMGLTLFLLPLALSLAACGGGGGGSPTPKATNTPTVAAQTPTATSGKTATPSATGTPAATSTATVGAGDAAAGQKAAQSASPSCLSCHSTNGTTIVGPTWKGLYGSQVTLSDGSTVTANDAYLQKSIVDPNAQIVKGFPSSVMPSNYGQTLSAQDITNIIAYIKSLK